MASLEIKLQHQCQLVIHTFEKSWENTEGIKTIGQMHLRMKMILEEGIQKILKDPWCF